MSLVAKSKINPNSFLKKIKRIYAALGYYYISQKPCKSRPSFSSFPTALESHKTFKKPLYNTLSSTEIVTLISFAIFIRVTYKY